MYLILRPMNGMEEEEGGEEETEDQDKRVI